MQIVYLCASGAGEIAYNLTIILLYPFADHTSSFPVIWTRDEQSLLTHGDRTPLAQAYQRDIAHPPVPIIDDAQLHLGTLSTTLPAWQIWPLTPAFLLARLLLRLYWFSLLGNSLRQPWPLCLPLMSPPASHGRLSALSCLMVPSFGMPPSHLGPPISGQYLVPPIPSQPLPALKLVYQPWLSSQMHFAKTPDESADE
jgi:hypothetical protein